MSRPIRVDAPPVSSNPATCMPGYATGMMADEALPNEPSGVWNLIVRADELVKYAGNRDPSTAYEQARSTLEKARRATALLQDRSIGENFERQIATRLDDLAKLES